MSMASMSVASMCVASLSATSVSGISLSLISLSPTAVLTANFSPRARGLRERGLFVRVSWAGEDRPFEADDVGFGREDGLHVSRAGEDRPAAPRSR